MGSRGLFVTGTDTGVGKTVVACALVRELRRAGLDVGVLKAVETGVGPAGPLDATALREAAEGVDSLEEVCPLRFALPAAPNVAARHEGGTVDLDRARRAFGQLASRHDVVVVEGAGGLLVPITDDANMADLAADLDLPLVVVARAALGTINHTLLTLSEAGRRQLTVAGVVISHSDGPLSDADEANLGYLRERLGELLLGEIPPLPQGEVPAPAAIRIADLVERLAGSPA
jgi:dethiobiotin synthetase